MKKKWIAAVLAIVLIVAMSLTSLAYSQQEKTADALNELGLFRGTGKGYELEKNLTRAEGATLLVRVLGKDDVAANWTAPIPFKDVPLWAMGYVGYAYQNGITNGTDMEKGEFSPNAELSDFMFLTLVLRALGYSDQGASPQFVWNDPYALAAQVGLIGKAKADNDFTRGDAVEVLWNAMEIELVGRNVTLAESLIDQDVFTSKLYKTARDIQKNGRKENAGVPDPERDPSISGNTNTGSNNNTGGSGSNTPEVEPIVHPWEKGGKAPSDYTWAEYNALDDKYKDGFYNWFGENGMTFEEWQTQAESENDRFEPEELPWENDGKQPSEYTWAEYQALTKGQQIAFQQSFDFDVWLQQMQPDVSGTPWESGKRPDEYTWAEFEALSGAQQMAFQNWFGSNAAFDRWKQDVQASEDTGDNRWEGGKHPSDYTWEEFNALEPDQQMAFQNWFGSNAAFERWMQNAQTAGDNRWEGDKQPSEYTWAEFEDLSPAQQIAFQNWFFENGEDFEEWMYSVID